MDTWKYNNVQLIHANKKEKNLIPIVQENGNLIQLWCLEVGLLGSNYEIKSLGRGPHGSILVV
jgi:hypothetical protein